MFRAFLSLSLFLLLLHMLVEPGTAHAAARDCDPDPGTNMEIRYSDSISCIFNGPLQDTDTFYFVGSAGDQPFIQTSSLITNAVALYSPSGKELDSRWGYNNTINNIELEEDGIHTIVVNSYYAVGDDDALYTLELPCLSGTCRDSIAPDGLGFYAVTPCRIVDTRYGIGGMMVANSSRSFRSYGNVSDQNKAAGGAPLEYPDQCPFPLGEHEAALLNITVVPMGPAGQRGFATVWPWNEQRPNSSWLNYVASLQNIANAGVVKTTPSTGGNPDFSVYVVRDVHLIIDVLGYYKD